MEHPGSSCELSEKRMSMKRKRTTQDDEVENMPPLKISPHLQDDLDNQPAENIVVETSSSSDEDSHNELERPQNFYQESTESPLDYNPDSFLSPPSLPELTNYVLSPLENVNRGESTPHSTKRASTSNTQCPTTSKRKCPLPGLSWADPADVWGGMCECDVESSMKKNPHMFDNHPNLQPRMRAILLDWLNEVCEVYKLHRETFHLTVDYIDRYLTNTDDVQKSRLQLIGITCLFIAAKVEEVYPPKIGEFAYVTDGACTADEILLEELHILKILSWNITPMTVNSWLNVYMQLASEGRNAQKRLIGEAEAEASALRGYTFVFPQCSSLELARAARLLDLAALHPRVRAHRASVLAAAAMAHVYDRELAARVSGYKWESIAACYRWMEPIATTLAACRMPTLRGADGEFVQRGADLTRLCPAANLDESHCIQQHNVTLDMFDKICEELDEPQPSSLPPELVFPPTPPRSDQKQPGDNSATPSATAARGTNDN